MTLLLHTHYVLNTLLYHLNTNPGSFNPLHNL
jgi:hypothetical protein